MLAKAKSGSPPSCSTLTRRVYFRTKIFCLKKKKKAALLVLFYIIIFTLLYIYVLSGGADDLGTQPYQDPLHLMVNKEDYPNLDVSDDDDNDSEGNVGDSVDLRRQQLREQQQQIQQLRHQLDQQQQPFLLDPRQLPSSTPSTRSPIMYTHSPPSSFKIYVYDLPPNFNLDIARKRPYCERGAFGTGIFIHKQLQQSVYRTHDPEEADLFYIPVYATCLVYIDFGLFEKYRLLIREAIDYVQQKYPYWHRSQGADHVWPLTHDFGACLSWEDNLDRVFYPELRTSIIVSHFGDLTSGCFSMHKDIVIPPMSTDKQIYLHGRGGAVGEDGSDGHSNNGGGYEDKGVDRNENQKRSNDGRKDESSHRSTFAHFQGSITWYHKNPHPLLHIEAGVSKSYSHGLRLKIQQLYGKDPLFFIQEGSSKTYHSDLRASRFCLCPRGFAPWSQRLFDAVMMGCIPVIIADGIVLPFESMLDYSTFTVKVLEKDVHKLKETLLSISEEQVARMQAVMRREEVWKVFSYQRPSQHGDAFSALLTELYHRSKHARPASHRAWPPKGK